MWVCQEQFFIKHLRVTGSTVCSHFLRYWIPGPSPWISTLLYKYRYINFGFVFLQDLIDRSLIEIVTNKPVEEPGVYIQQFPCPCYVEDKWVLTFLEIKCNYLIFCVLELCLTKVYWRTCQPSVIEILAKIVNWLKSLALFLKNFMINPLSASVALI